ncbi:MAG: hypothetical protein JWM98_1975 [Thermoleophilia bacterium]|nr:hypothetical protein [Thermoleophilia bacterium]
MGIDLHVRSRPLQPDDHATARGTLTAAAVGGAAGTVVSGIFHHAGPPHMAIGRPWAVATLGVGMMTALSAGLLSATNHGAGSPGHRSNSMLESTALSAVAFGVPGILIHGRMDFSGNPVARGKAAIGVALTGAIAGPLIHELTAPDD